MIDPFKKKALNRLKRAKGQIDGIINMIESDKDCIDTITQILALQGAIKGVQKTVLESHLNTCGNKMSTINKDTFIAELVKVFELSKR